MGGSNRTPEAKAEGGEPARRRAVLAPRRKGAEVLISAPRRLERSGREIRSAQLGFTIELGAASPHNARRLRANGVRLRANGVTSQLHDCCGLELRFRTGSFEFALGGCTEFPRVGSWDLTPWADSRRRAVLAPRRKGAEVLISAPRRLERSGREIRSAQLRFTIELGASSPQNARGLRSPAP